MKTSWCSRTYYISLFFPSHIIPPFPAWIFSLCSHCSPFSFDLYCILSRVTQTQSYYYNIIWWYIYTINDDRLKQHLCTLFHNIVYDRMLEMTATIDLDLSRGSAHIMLICCDKRFFAADLIAKCLRIACDSMGSNLLRNRWTETSNNIVNKVADCYIVCSSKLLRK